MAAFFSNLRNTVIAGFVLAFVVFLIYLAQTEFNGFIFWPFLVRWLHIGSGVMWIGLLWYFNFVQTPTMPKIPDELKGGVSRFIAPAALFWFRWGAMSTIVCGHPARRACTAICSRPTRSISIEGLIDLKAILIGIGMWLGTIMWFNVWFVIWPNQQKALNIGNAYPDLPADQKRPRRRAPRACSRASTRCSRSRCCSAWSQGRIWRDEFASRRKGRPAIRAAFFVEPWPTTQTLGMSSSARVDFDRYLSSLFAPAAAAARSLNVLYAFNYEVAKTAETVSQPIAGQIRLQWWRDRIAELYRGVRGRTSLSSRP